jgi:hypothetical protein
LAQKDPRYPVGSLRYFNASGATADRGEDHKPETHLIPLVLQVALGQRETISIYGDDYDTPDGTCIRDYVHVSDLASAHLLALHALDRSSDDCTYNLGNGNGFSVREVIETARLITAHPIPISKAPRRPGDVARLVADSRKISADLNWKPKQVALASIIESAWRWKCGHPMATDQVLNISYFPKSNLWNSACIKHRSALKTRGVRNCEKCNEFIAEQPALPVQGTLSELGIWPWEKLEATFDSGGDFICLSHLRWNFVYQRPQHLMSRCARERRVFFVEEPIPTTSSLPTLDLRMEDCGVCVVVPRIPGNTAAEFVSGILESLMIELYSRCGIHEPVLWYYTPMAYQFTKRLPARARVYDCMDELSLFDGAPASLTELEAELIRQADVIFTGGKSLYEAKRHFAFEYTSGIEQHRCGSFQDGAPGRQSPDEFSPKRSAKPSDRLCRSD